MLVTAGCGGGDAPSPRPVPPPAQTPPGLQTGILEGNANLLTPGTVPAEFVPWRDRLAALRPHYVRVLVDWEKLQPDGNAPPRFDFPADGCMRGTPPCAPFAGIRDVLKALAARRAGGAEGWEPIAVIYGTPPWAARRPEADPPGSGTCGLSDRAREPDPVAYRALVRALRAEAQADGVPIRWWAPWNEPNHPAFLAPQRADCSARSTSTSAARYARIVEAFRAEQQAGDRLLLGELAGYDEPRRSASTVKEFIDDLPREVVCATTTWAQHLYVAQTDEAAGPEGDAPLAGDADAAGSPGLLRDVLAALDRRGCPRPHRLWLTETGVGGPRPGREAPTDPAEACRAMAAALATWQADRRIAVAIQYSFREDPSFPVGLADAGLTTLYPAYAPWREAPAGGNPGEDGCT
ncbi:MAG: hypothetical protein JHC95_16780 [Solirubrobacteraceae bacterium]|nr:hypothetical protein [Solirubrobacteraceae bacterium]